MMRSAAILATGFVILGFGASARAADDKKAKPALESASALAFGPNGVLFVGDTKAGMVVAIETGDTRAAGEAAPINVANINGAVADMLGTKPQNISINDVVVNPASGRAYLSVARGQGPDAVPVLLSVGSDGKLAEVSIDAAKVTKTALPNPAKAGGRVQRTDVITDIAFVDGKVLVAGLSNEEFASRLVALKYPFEDASEGAGIEIFHGAHGRVETNSPVRTFVPYALKDQTYILAAYTCTPLVKIPVAELQPGAKVKGTTIAELGNRNKPLDMIVYTKDGKDFLLLANSNRGVMKIPTEGAATAASINKRVADTEGLKYETIAALKDVLQLDKLSATHALILARSAEGSLDLKTIDLP
ncbi:MAG: hypothetical protein SFX72_23255 [Isosphaeraceae bacterium]|nr:hypothetical protein [Isosphaeraceae bacterium]